MKKDALRIMAAVGFGVAAGTAACEATGIINIIPDSQPNNPNTLTVDPTLTEQVTPTEVASRNYTGRIDFNDNTDFRGVVSATFQIDAQNIYTYSVYATSFATGEKEKEILLAYNITPEGQLRTFVWSGNWAQETQRVIEDGYVHEFYNLADGQRYDVQVYPEDSSKIGELGIHFFPPDPFIAERDYPGLGTNSISVQIDSQGKVQAIYKELTDPESPLPEGQLRNLQERLGGSFTVVETEEVDETGNKIYELQDKEKNPIPNLKLYTDGKSSLAIQWEDQPVELMVADDVIRSGEMGELKWGGMVLKNDEWQTLVNGEAQFSLPEGLDGPKADALLKTILLYPKMAVFEHSNPVAEFDTVTINGKPMNWVINGWTRYDFNRYSLPYVSFIPKLGGGNEKLLESHPEASPFKTPLDVNARYAINVFNPKDGTTSHLVGLPVKILDQGKIVKVVNAWVTHEAFDSMVVPNLTSDNMHEIFPVMITGIKLTKYSLSSNFGDEFLRSLMTKVNKKAYLVKYPLVGDIDWTLNKNEPLPLEIEDAVFDLNIR